LGDTLVVVSAVVVVDPGARTQAVTVPGAEDQMNMLPDCPSKSRDGATIVAKPVDVEGPDAVYVKVVVPVAPLES
jgi:hypothetical protein